LKHARLTWNITGRHFRVRVKNSDKAGFEAMELVLEATPGGVSFAS